MGDKNNIKAVLWDFGGVFTTSPFEAFNQYEKEHSLPQNFIRTLNSTNPDSNAWAQLERNELSVSSFCKAFEMEAQHAGYAVDGAGILSCIHGSLRKEMVRALRSLATKYKTACLTNNFEQTPRQSHHDSQAIREVMGLFDAVIESSKLGFRKPEKLFYEYACSTLKISPEEAVFLDDLGVNLKPARQMGMQTIKVTSASQGLKDLEKCLGHKIS